VDSPELPEARYWLPAGLQLAGETQIAGEFTPELIPRPPTPDQGDPTVSITGQQGNLLFRLVPGPREPALLSARWTDSATGGCGPGEIHLHPDAGLRIEQFSPVRIAIDGVEFYQGYVASAPEVIKARGDTLVERSSAQKAGQFYKLEGFVKLLEKNSAPVGSFQPYDPNIPYRIPERELFAGDFVDYGLSFLDTAERFVQPPIVVSATEIDTDTGVHQLRNLDLSKAGSLADIFEFLSTGARRFWGVDAQGRLYLRANPPGIQRILFAGRDFTDYEVRYDYKVSNIFEIRRKRASGSGTELAAWGKDDNSIRRWGRQAHKPITVPGWISDEDCALLIEALKQDHAEPKVSIQIAGLPLRGASARFTIGIYRFVSMPYTHYRLLSDCETLSELSGELVDQGRVSVVSDLYYSGAGALRIELLAGDAGRTLVWNFDESVAFATLRLWVRAQTPTRVELTLGCGLSTPFERTLRQAIAPGPFHAIEFDVRHAQYSRLRYFALRIESNEPALLWIDSLGADYSGYRSFDQQWLRADYELGPDGARVKAEFGVAPAQWAAPVLSLINTVNELKIATEVSED
jgi:hypothetical protein